MARHVRFWDLSSTLTGDYTAGIKMAKDGRLYTVEHLIHGRWTPFDRDQVILQTAQADGIGCEVVIEQEPGSSGVSQVDSLVALLAGYKVSGKRSTGDKVTRAAPLASQAEAGNVRLVNGPYVRALLDEICSFPTEGVHDDIVDAMSGAFLVLSARPENPLAGLVSFTKARGW